ncbi:MAG TPA: restriction endonuclease [Polyangiaceae bacterium]
MMRAGQGGRHIDDFVEKKAIAFAGERVGALSPQMSKDELLERFAEKYPEEKDGSRASWASQLLRFMTEMKIGDDVLVFDRARRRYVFGKVTSEYKWRPGLVDDSPHVRSVEWTNEIRRDVLSTATKNTLGSTLTLFKLSADAAQDIQSHKLALGKIDAEPAVASPKEEDEGLGLLSEEQFEKANEFIEDRIDRLNWEEMQELVAGVLRAMGYRTTVSEAGPDRGVDVFASPDGLGLQDPRIFVEVKHRSAQMGAKEIRAFLGGRSKGDKCLYVSTGGFSKDAQYEAERADVALSLITLPRLRQLVVEFYEKLDSETRALVPLRRLYWPVKG